MSKMIRTVNSLFAFAAVTWVATLAHAQDAAPGVGQGGHQGLMYLALALGLGLAAFGGAMGQSRAAAAALEGICRNPSAESKVFTPMLLALALIESLVLLVFVLMYLLYNKL
jgi:F-type H+-transporting ATPase subunit c